MTTSQEMDQQFGDSEIERRLKDAESFIAKCKDAGIDTLVESGYLQFNSIPMRWDAQGRQVLVGTNTSDRYFYEFLVSRLVPNPTDGVFPLLAAGGYVSATEIQHDWSAYLTSGNYGRTFEFADDTPEQRAGAEAARGATIARGFANIGAADAGHFKIEPALLMASNAARPTGLAAGGVWYGTDNKLYLYDGSSDVELSAGGGSMPMPPVVGPFSDVALGTELAANAAAAPAAAVWPTANLAIAYPFRVTEDSTAYKLWYSGSTAASGNIDIGIYDSAFAKVISTGSNVHAAATTVIDVANTALTTGLYYFAVAIDNTTAQMSRFATASRGFGMVQMAAAFALPTTFVPAAIANLYLPQAGVILRSGFDI
jgi:hypothetical protein